MWLLYAAGSAFFAGVTSILAKCGIRKTNSTVATTFVFLILSGAATGASWLCYFKALQTGEINKVVPVDKSSTVLTILLALILPA